MSVLHQKEYIKEISSFEFNAKLTSSLAENKLKIDEMQFLYKKGTHARFLYTTL